MAELTLDVARKILDAALAKGIEKKLKPLVVTVLDARGCVKVTAAQDGTSLMRAEIAHGKAYGALAMGMGSRALFQRAQEQAYFVGAVNTLAQGRLVPVPGGVLIQDGGVLLGAVGVSGDTSDNDEICACGIEAAASKANAGLSTWRAGIVAALPYGTVRSRIYRPGHDGLRFSPNALRPFLGVLRHRQQRDLAFGVGDAFVERHRGDRAHGVFAAPDRGRRLVDDAADQPVDLGVELGRRHHVVQKPGGLRGSARRTARRSAPIR